MPRTHKLLLSIFVNAYGVLVEQPHLNGDPLAPEQPLDPSDPQSIMSEHAEAILARGERFYCAIWFNTPSKRHWNLFPLSSKLPTGDIYITPGARDVLNRSTIDPVDLLKRHVSHDWGTLDDADHQTNIQALFEDKRILSNYKMLSGERIYIITEADRSSTTILLPEEY